MTGKSRVLNELRAITKELSEHTSLIYAGIVGSFRYSKNMPRDIDILLLFDKLDLKQYKYSVNSFWKCARALSNSVQIIVEERNGPFKPSKEGIVQFHLIFHDRVSFNHTAEVAPLSYIEWTMNNDRLFGDNLFSLFKKKDKITKEDLLNSDFGSVNSSLKLLDNGQIYYALYKDIKGKLELIIKNKKATKSEWNGLLVGVVKANVRNFVKYTTGELSPDNELIDKISKNRLSEVYTEIRDFYAGKNINVDGAKRILISIKKEVDA